jgi:hypothetical protein
MSRQSDPPLSPNIFVYDATAAWGELRGGSTVQTGEEVGPLDCLSRDALNMILKSEGRRLPLEQLQSGLVEKHRIHRTEVNDVLCRMGSIDVLLIEENKDGFCVRLSESLEKMYRRREYLSTFTSELLTRSRRIDLLVGHSGTVGSYREELLRGLLKRILPRRYEATTGFIEGCPRQLDIIVWDVENYAPLFMEQNFVVVPLAAVRAVIEVKTTLTKESLCDGLEILWDTFKDRQTIIPVFKGVFAFETDLIHSATIAKHMKEFYGSTDKFGSARRHGYHWAGINGVCVPSKHLVRERYRLRDDDVYHQPMLVGVANQIGGDAYSAIFLGVLLSHLEIASAAKLQNFATFRPVLSALEEQDFDAIYGDWKPSRPLPGHTAILGQAEAEAYVKQVHDFRAGHIEGNLVGKNLTRPSHADSGDDAASPDGDGSRSTNG